MFFGSNSTIWHSVIPSAGSADIYRDDVSNT